MKISNDDSPTIITQELGARLRQARLNLNVTQASRARLAGVTRKKVMHAEAGDVDLITLVALLRAMHLADQLDNFLPLVPISHSAGQTGRQEETTGLRRCLQQHQSEEMCLVSRSSFIQLRPGH